MTEIRRIRKEARAKTLQILDTRVPVQFLWKRSEKQFAKEVNALAVEGSIFAPAPTHDSLVPVLDDLYDERDRGRAAATVVEELLVELQEPINRFSKLTSSILYANHIALKPLAAFQSTLERFLARLIAASMGGTQSKRELRTRLSCKSQEVFDHLAFTKEIRTDLAVGMRLAITTAEHDLESLF
ncbi:MAG: hypothetical protein Q9174_002806 [Haloplaca sp. 1 TL-2023]